MKPKERLVGEEAWKGLGDREREKVRTLRRIPSLEAGGLEDE